jgi:hypothetical protein
MRSTLEHKILAFLLVPHSSHLAQPLDATIFGPLKRILSGRTTPLFQLGITRIQKAEWIEAYYQAHHQVFSAKNIKAGFSSTGIYPFNPDKVLDRIRSMPVLAPVTTRAATPASPTTPELHTCRINFNFSYGNDFFSDSSANKFTIGFLSFAGSQFRSKSHG